MEPFDIRTVDEKTGKSTMSEEELSAFRSRLYTTHSGSILGIEILRIC